MIFKDDEVIIAQCTPKGKGAIAMIRLCGHSVRSLVSKISILPNLKKLENLPSNTVHMAWIIDDNKNTIDQVMFIILDGPKTFTGQDTIEITC